MKKTGKIFAITGALLFMGLTNRAQDNDQAMMKQIEQDNQAAVDAIALYPADTRKDILEASRCPEILVRLNAMQKQSKDQFAEMLAPYSKEEQEEIWNLTRYPALISELVYDHRKSERELDDILARYPSEIRKTAREQALRNYDLLVDINRSNYTYQAGLDRILQGYSNVTGAAYRNLIRQPEILSTLYDNMQMTVVLGDVYRTDPQYVLFETDSLNQALTQQNAQGAEDWKQSLNQDPEAQQEYVQAAEEYAQENGYQAPEYSAEMSPDVVNYNTYPYNWWFGYPTWYTTPCWDPYPFWYDWGFYYGPGHRPVFFGMPSYYFMNWYFYNPEHCHRYPHFGDHCYGYYTGHRGGRYSNPVSRGVNDWRRRNKDVVTKDWDNDKAGRAQRFKEYGQMETERTKYNKANPGHPMERKDYLSKNQNQYPHTTYVAVTPKQNPRGSSYERGAPPQQTPVTRPHVKIPDSYYQSGKNTSTPSGVKNEERPVKTPSEEVRPGRNSGRGNTPVETPPARPINNQTRGAQEFHQSTWHEVQPQQHYSAPVRSEPPSRPSSPPPSGGGGGRRK
jgi:hypothetical protein